MNGILNLINSANKAETATAGAVTRKDIDTLFKLMYEKVIWEKTMLDFSRYAGVND